MIRVETNIINAALRKYGLERLELIDVRMSTMVNVQDTGSSPLKEIKMATS